MAGKRLFCASFLSVSYFQHRSTPVPALGECSRDTVVVCCRGLVVSAICYLAPSALCMRTVCANTIGARRNGASQDPPRRGRSIMSCSVVAANNSDRLRPLHMLLNHKVLWIALSACRAYNQRSVFLSSHVSLSGLLSFVGVFFRALCMLAPKRCCIVLCFWLAAMRTFTHLIRSVLAHKPRSGHNGLLLFMEYEA